MQAQERSPYRLTNEQVEEVRQRLQDPNPKYLAIEEVEKHFQLKGRSNA